MTISSRCCKFNSTRRLLQTPQWLRAACGHFLTDILTSASGVKSVVCGMITSDTDSWMKFKMAGHVIATPPRGWSAECYYRLIAPQASLIPSLRSDAMPLDRRNLLSCYLLTGARAADRGGSGALPSVRSSRVRHHIVSCRQGLSADDVTVLAATDL